METWKNGREELLKTFDAIGAKIASELDVGNSILIDRDELRTIQAEARRATALEEEVSRLKSQNETQDTKNAQLLQLLQERDLDHQRMVQASTILTEKLDAWDGVSRQVKDLERENQRLVSALEQQQLQPADQIDDKVSKSTPALADIPSSVRKVSEYDGYDPVAGDVYRALTIKYNTLTQNWSDLKTARKTLDQKLRDERVKARDWSSRCEALDKKLTKREGKIQRLEEELQQFRGQGTKSTASVSPTRSAQSMAPLKNGAQPLSSLDDVATVLRSANIGRIQLDGHVVGVEDFLHSLANQTSRPSVMNPLRVQVPKSSSPLKIRPVFDALVPGMNKQSYSKQAPDQGTLETIAPAEENVMNPGSPTLPTAIMEEQGDVTVDDTEYEMILRHHSSSTTEGEADSPNIPRRSAEVAKRKLLPSSPSMPVVISARSVKKRNGRKATAGTTSTPAPRIKFETIGSSPIIFVQSGGSNISQCLDLDDIGEKQSTPRKQRPVQRHMGEALPRGAITRETDSMRKYRSESVDHSHPGQEQLSNGRSQSTPVVGPSPRRKDSALQPRSTNQQVLPSTSDVRAAKRRRIASAEAIQSLFEDGENLEVSAMRGEPDNEPQLDSLLLDLLDKPTPPKNNITPQYRQISRLNEPSSRLYESRAYEPDPADDFAGSRYSETPRTNVTPALHNVNRFEEGYKPGNQKTSNGHKSSRNLTHETGDTAASTLRPSSKDTPSGFGTSAKPSSKRTFKDSAYGSRPPSRELHDDPDDMRIELADDMRYELEMPLSKGQARMAELFSKPSSRSPYSNDNTPSRPPSKHTANTGKMSVSKRLARTAGEVFNAEVDHPSNERLRSRPLEKLDIDDFKINPKSNGGHNFAYSEVVRGRERRCLPGCTKPECCGNQFRFLAKVARDPNKPPTMSQEERDQELCEEYLGANAYKLRNMTQAEKDEILLRAQTRDLTNRYGRHKQAYERRQSPPGFWDLDFPTTQEGLENAVKQHAMQRDLVRQRYEEAMRPNGRYVFRDE